MDSVKNFFNSLYTPKDSDFYKSGYLTPEQFIQAGDQLAKAGWKWQSAVAGRSSKLLTNPNKQFLSADARSSQRIKEIMTEQSEEKEENGWVVAKEVESLNKEANRNRNYKISITYDDYYHTPRMWLSGFDEDGKILSDNEIFEDIMNEYQNETVTVMDHPHLGVRQVSIHPCKHSEVLKNLINKAEECGGKIEPYQALFVFLKFMSSVMPTIEYDFSADVRFEC